MKRKVISLVKKLIKDDKPKETIFYYVGKMVCLNYDLLEVEKKIYKFKDELIQEVNQ